MSAVGVGGVWQGGEGPVVVAVAFRASPGGHALPGSSGKVGGEGVDADAGAHLMSAGHDQDVPQS